MQAANIILSCFK